MPSPLCPRATRIALLRLASFAFCVSGCTAPGGAPQIEAKLARAQRLELGRSAKVYFEVPRDGALLAPLLAELGVPSSLEVVFLPPASEQDPEQSHPDIADALGRVIRAYSVDFPKLDETRLEQLAFLQHLVAALVPLEQVAPQLEAGLRERLIAALTQTLLDPAKRRAWFALSSAHASSCGSGGASPLGWWLDTSSSTPEAYALLALRESVSASSRVEDPGLPGIDPEILRRKLGGLDLPPGVVDGVLAAIREAAAETAAAANASACVDLIAHYFRPKSALEPHKRFLALALVLDASRTFVEEVEYRPVGALGPYWALDEVYDHYQPRTWIASPSKYGPSSGRFSFQWQFRGDIAGERLTIRHNPSSKAKTSITLSATRPRRGTGPFELTVKRSEGAVPVFYPSGDFRRIAEHFATSGDDERWALPPCIKWEKADSVSLSFGDLPTEADLERIADWLMRNAREPRASKVEAAVSEYRQASEKETTYFGQSYALYAQAMRRFYWSTWIRSGGSAEDPESIHPREVLPPEALEGPPAN